MTIYHVVVLKPYTDVSGFVLDLEKFGNVLACQHAPDEEDKTVHCHIMCDTDKTAEAIRKRIVFHHLDGRGQYAIMLKTKKLREVYDVYKLAVYILKGERDNLKLNKGYSNDFIEAALGAWQPLPVKADINLDKKSKSESKDTKTHYQLIKEIYDKASKTTRLVRDEFGNLVNEHCIENSVATWHLMCKVLNENHIRTSSHELERFYVTLLRQDPLHQEDLYNNLMRKLNSRNQV